MRFVPDIYFDSTGASFSYPLARILCGSIIVAYVHYPIISADMLQAVREQRPSYNNDKRIASNIRISQLKLVYYSLFAQLYAATGSFADLVFVNSSWTQGHISQLWGISAVTQDSSNDEGVANRAESLNPASRLRNTGTRGRRRLIKLFPPCNTKHLQALPLNSEVGGVRRKRDILSIGQFRPEKDHQLQLKALRSLLDSNSAL